MEFSVPQLVARQKLLSIYPHWKEEANGNAIGFVAPLEIDGVTIEGLQLRGRARTAFPNKDLMFQIEYHPASMNIGPLSRIDWRPVHGHTNKGRGPVEHQYLQIPWGNSHVHKFKDNWIEKESRMLRSNLPIAIPLTDDPENYDKLIELVEKKFKITGIADVLNRPGWQPSLF